MKARCTKCKQCPSGDYKEVEEVVSMPRIGGAEHRSGFYAIALGFVFAVFAWLRFCCIVFVKRHNYQIK